MKRLLPAFTVAIGLAFSFVPEANAAPACKAASFSFTACSGSYSLGGGEKDVTDGGANNLATQKLNEGDIFGDGDWQFGGKHDGKISGDNDEELSLEGLGSTSGNFGFSNIDWETTEVAISLKSGQGYSLYYLTESDLNENGMLAWDTTGTMLNKQGKAQALSHISYYTRISAMTPEMKKRLKQVAEPTGISSLLAIGLVAALRKSSKRRG